MGGIGYQKLLTQLSIYLCPVWWTKDSESGSFLEPGVHLVHSPQSGVSIEFVEASGVSLPSKDVLEATV